jgi:hypothetical protein
VQKRGKISYRRENLNNFREMEMFGEFRKNCNLAIQLINIQKEFFLNIIFCLYLKLTSLGLKKFE